MILAIEGIDSSGKATQARLLAKHLKGAVLSFPTTPARRPHILDPAYETEVGREIRKLLKTPDPDVLILQALMTLNRYEMVDRMHALVKEGPLVLDRYYVSGVVYGSVDGLPEPWLWSIHSSLPQPDVWILLNTSVEESFTRRPDREDRYEADRWRLAQVRLKYLRVFNEKAATEPERWHVVDGAGSILEVHERIKRALGM